MPIGNHSPLGLEQARWCPSHPPPHTAAFTLAQCHMDDHLTDSVGHSQIEHHRLNGYESEQSPGDSEGGKPGMLWSMGSRRIRHDWATEQQQVWTELESLHFQPHGASLPTTLGSTTSSGILNDLNKLRAIPCSWTERLNHHGVSFLRLTYKSIILPAKDPTELFCSLSLLFFFFNLTSLF